MIESSLIAFSAVREGVHSHVHPGHVFLAAGTAVPGSITETRSSARGLRVATSLPRTG